MDESSQPLSTIQVGTGQRTWPPGRRAKMITLWTLVGAMIIGGGIGSYFLFFSHADSLTPAYMSRTPAINGAAALGLDPTGTQIPDSNYQVNGCDVTVSSCAGAVFMAPAPTGNDSNTGTKTAPVATLNKAVSLTASGGTIVIRGGTYRDMYNDGAGNPADITKSLTLQAYPHEQVWFRGTDVIPTSAWTSDGKGHWSMPWSTPSFCAGGYYKFAPNAQSGSSAHPGANTGPCSYFDDTGDAINPLAGDPQLMYMDSSYVHQATSLAAAQSHNFYYDWTNHRIWMVDNPAGHTIELAVRPTALQLHGDNSKVLGIGFRLYATNQYSNATRAAVVLYGNNEVVENSAFVRNAGGALSGSTSTNSRISHNVFSTNGFNGMSWNGSGTAGTDNLTLDRNVFERNNVEYFATRCSISCNAANVKMSHITKAIIKGNVFQNSTGTAPGYWCDIDCTHVSIINNLAQDNAGAGIFYEVSDSGIIASNMLINNNLNGTGASMYVSSPNTEIYNNTVIANATHTGYGIFVYDDSRTQASAPTIGPDTRGVSVGNNIIETNSFPIIAQSPGGSADKAPNTGADQFFTAFDYDAYFSPSGPALGMFNWRPLGGSSTQYKSLSSFVAAKPWENHGIATYSVPASGLPFFKDPTHSDYSVPAGSAAYHSGGPMPADAASIVGGLSPAAGRSRGAIVWPGQ